LHDKRDNIFLIRKLGFVFQPGLILPWRKSHHQVIALLQLDRDCALVTDNGQRWSHGGC